jgi:hypothetical protein
MNELKHDHKSRGDPNGGPINQGHPPYLPIITANIRSSSATRSHGSRRVGIFPQSQC